VPRQLAVSAEPRRRWPRKLEGFAKSVVPAPARDGDRSDADPNSPIGVYTLRAIISLT